MKPLLSARCAARFGLLLSLVIGPGVGAQTNFTLLKSLTGTPDGAVPMCALAEDGSGTLYGTTAAGGTNGIYGGTVFKLGKDGFGYAVLKSFSGLDGLVPRAGVLVADDGFLYGTAYGGGVSNLGVVFKVGTDGSSFNVLHHFTGGSDGKNPSAPLIQGKDGALYGTTYFGTSPTRGTVFRINRDGTGYVILHAFAGNPDGQQCLSPVMQGSDGMLYGTTYFGGSFISGTIFRLRTNGTDYAVLRSFEYSGDGKQPAGGLLEGTDGRLYGTTYSGGSDSAGTIFRINRDGSGYSVLRSFLATGGDGRRPVGELIEGSDGALYGCTDTGGSSGYRGVVYKVNKGGSGYAILRHFTAGDDGDIPYAGLTGGNNGTLFGTTQYGGGAAAGGCVFALSSAPLPSRILTVAPSAGSNVVSFAGTSAVQYDVQRSSDVTSWIHLGTLTAPMSGNMTYTDFTAPPQAAFYRIKLH